MKEIKNLSLFTLPACSFLLLFSGCAAPVLMGDGKIEKPLTEVTSLRTEDIEKASQKTEMNLWDVYALAVERTESLANKVENIEQAEAQGQQAIGSLLPQISLNGSKGWQSDNYIGSLAPSTTNTSSSAVYVSGTETLLTGLDQVAAIQGAQALKDQNRHALKQEARNLLLSVAKAFYSVLQAEDSLTTKQETLKLTEQILKQEQQWKAIGRSRDSDVLSTEAELAQLKGDLENIQNQLTQSRENLVVLANLKTDQVLKSEETTLPPSETLAQAEVRVEERSDVLSAKAAAGVADAVLLQAHGQHLPSVSAQGNYYLAKEGGASSPEWNVQLVASLPLFEGGTILAKERSAASKKRQSDLQYSLVHRQALEDIRGAYQNLSSSLRQVEAYGKALEAAKKDYEAVARDRRLALNTNLDLLQSLTSLQNAQTNYNQAHYQSLINSVWYRVAIGELPKTETPKP